MACCRGHDYIRYESYLQIEFNERSVELIDGICSYMYSKENPEFYLSFSYGSYIERFSITMLNESTKHQCLKFISNHLDNLNQIYKLQTNIPRIASELLSFAKKEDLDCIYLLSSEEMMFAYSRHNVVYHPDKYMCLDDIIDEVEATSNIPLYRIKCDENSIQRFLKVINPEYDNNRIFK